MVLRDVQNGSSEMGGGSVELECIWKRVFVAVFVPKTGVLKLGMTDFIPCGSVDRKTKKEERSERTNARACFAHDGDKHMDEPKLRTGVLHSPCLSVGSNSERTQLCECWTEAVGK